MKRPGAYALGTAILLIFAIRLAAVPARSAAMAEPQAHVPTAAARSVTFTRDIAPILFQNCASCHHAGDIGPFPLLEYEDARKRAHQIAAVTGSRYMPPWHAQSHGEFEGERKLSSKQIADIRAWADTGAAEGSVSDLPARPSFPHEWTLGTPDAVFEPEAAYTVGAEGTDETRCFVLPTHFAEDRYIAGLEVKPGNRAAVHHVVACLDTTGRSRALQQASDGPGFTPRGNDVNPSNAIAVWAPGCVPLRLPDGVGTLLPKGADIVLQVHYSKTGKPETDRTKIGVNFCRGPVDKRARFLLLFQPYLDIPAGDANYVVRAFPTPAIDDITIFKVMPHMHLLGRTMTVTAKLPDHTQKVLIHVPDWDYRWQTTYTFKEPVRLPKHSIVTMTASYDNSERNAHNPSHPPRRVHWGALSKEEMCIAGLMYTSDSEHLTRGKVSEGFYNFGRF